MLCTCWLAQTQRLKLGAMSYNWTQLHIGQRALAWQSEHCSVRAVITLTSNTHIVQASYKGRIWKQTKFESYVFRMLLLICRWITTTLETTVVHFHISDKVSWGWSRTVEHSLQAPRARAAFITVHFKQQEHSFAFVSSNTNLQLGVCMCVCKCILNKNQTLQCEHFHCDLRMRMLTQIWIATFNVLLESVQILK